MRSEGGFGIVAVMAGAVVLGIFALVYTQQMQNRANISLIGDLMSFREQVITYYSSIVSNRNTWECTVKSNAELQQYLAGCTTAPCPTPKPAGANAPDGTLNIYDYTGDCQERFGTGTGTLRIPSGGLGLRLQDYNDLPIGQVACNANVHHFCLTVEWEGLDPDQASRRAVELKLVLKSYRKNIKNDLGVSFELADKEHAIYMNRTVATDCSDGRVTGYFPGRRRGSARPWHPSHLGGTGAAPHMTSKGVSAYAGDTAVVKFDSLTGLVECSSRGPLVIPPCYDVDTYDYIDDYGAARRSPEDMVNPFVSGTGMPGYRGFKTDYGFGGIDGTHIACDGTARATHGAPPSAIARAVFKGKCPETLVGSISGTGGQGTTAIAYFDPHTGISHCSNPNILVEKVNQSETSKNCDEKNQYGVVRIRASDDTGGKVGTFECSTNRWGVGRGGVEPGKGDCDQLEALAGFHSNTGRITTPCADNRNNTDNPGGFRGPPGPDGKDGAWLHSKDNSYVGPTGPPGPDRTCSSSDCTDDLCPDGESCVPC